MPASILHAGGDGQSPGQPLASPGLPPWHGLHCQRQVIKPHLREKMATAGAKAQGCDNHKKTPGLLLPSHATVMPAWLLPDTSRALSPRVNLLAVFDAAVATTRSARQARRTPDSFALRSDEPGNLIIMMGDAWIRKQGRECRSPSRSSRRGPTRLQSTHFHTYKSHHCLRRILSRGSSRQESISEFMASSDGLGSLSILNEDSLRLILRDETLKDSLDHIASSSTQLLRQVLRSGMKLTLYLGDMKLAAKWGEWLQQASGLHLQLEAGYLVRYAAANLTRLLPAPSESQPRPNLGISVLTVDLDVSDMHGSMGAEGVYPRTGGRCPASPAVFSVCVELVRPSDWNSLRAFVTLSGHA